MNYVSLKKVVIVIESVIKDAILEQIFSLGAKGYTIALVSGKGERGVREVNSTLGEYLKNIRIDIITSSEIADKIVFAVENNFLKNYAGIVYIEDVKVLKNR